MLQIKLADTGSSNALYNVHCTCKSMRATFYARDEHSTRCENIRSTYITIISMVEKSEMEISKEKREKKRSKSFECINNLLLNALKKKYNDIRPFAKAREERKKNQQHFIKIVIEIKCLNHISGEKGRYNDMDNT